MLFLIANLIIAFKGASVLTAFIDFTLSSIFISVEFNMVTFRSQIAGGFGGAGDVTQYVMRYSIEKLIKMGWLVIDVSINI